MPGTAMAATAASFVPAPAPVAPESLLPVAVGAPQERPAEGELDLDIDLDIDEGFLQRVRDI